MTTYKIGYFVGSLATKSINRLLAKALVRVAPADLELTEIAHERARLAGQLASDDALVATLRVDRAQDLGDEAHVEAAEIAGLGHSEEAHQSARSLNSGTCLLSRPRTAAVRSSPVVVTPRISVLVTIRYDWALPSNPPHAAPNAGRPAVR